MKPRSSQSTSPSESGSGTSSQSRSNTVDSLKPLTMGRTTPQRPNSLRTSTSTSTSTESDSPRKRPLSIQTDIVTTPISYQIYLGFIEKQSLERVKLIEDKEYNELFYRGKQTLVDWERKAWDLIYFNGKKAFNSIDEFHQILEDQAGNLIDKYGKKFIGENLPKTDESIIDYIQRYSHQYGFFDIPETGLSRLGSSCNRRPNFNGTKGRYDFIENKDGSVTFINRFYIDSYSSFGENGNYTTVQTENPPIAIAVSVSTIRLDNEEIKHEFNSNNIFLLDTLGKELFVEKKAEKDLIESEKSFLSVNKITSQDLQDHTKGIIDIIEKITPQQIEQELDDEIELRISFRKLIKKVNLLRVKFDGDKSEKILNDLLKLTNKITKSHNRNFHWILLQSTIQTLIDCILAQTSVAETNERDKICKNYEDKKKDGSANHTSVLNTNDIEAEKQKEITEASAKYQHKADADLICKSGNFKTLRELVLKLIVSPNAIYDKVKILSSKKEFNPKETQAILNELITNTNEILSLEEKHPKLNSRIDWTLIESTIKSLTTYINNRTLPTYFKDFEKLEKILKKVSPKANKQRANEKKEENKNSVNKRLDQSSQVNQKSEETKGFFQKMKEEFQNGFKKHPFIYGMLAGLVGTVVLAGVAAAVVFSAGGALPAVAGAAGVIGSAITAGALTGTSAAILGGALIGTGTAVTGAIIGGSIGAAFASNAADAPSASAPIADSSSVGQTYSTTAKLISTTRPKNTSTVPTITITPITTPISTTAPVDKITSPPTIRTNSSSLPQTRIVNQGRK